MKLLPAFLALWFCVACNSSTTSEAAEPTKAADTASATPTAGAEPRAPTAGNGATGEPKCDRLIPATEVKEVCGVDQPLIAAMSEGATQAILCARETSAQRVNKVAVAITDYGTEAVARGVAGNPAPGESAIELKERRSGSVSTTASMFRGGLVVIARTRTVGAEAPFCNQGQLKALAKRVYDRLP